MNDVIKSRKNSLVTHLRSLKLKKYRDEFQEYVVEGTVVICDALGCNVPIKMILISEDYQIEPSLSETLQEKNIPLYVFSADVFASMTDTKSPQGIIAVCMQNSEHMFAVEEGQNGFYLFCDQIKDPGNLGTIIRNAAAFRASGVILSKECVDLYNEKVIRSTMGTMFHVPIISCMDDLEMLQNLKNHGIEIWAGTLNAKEDIREVVPCGKVCIVVGNEANGVSDQVLALTDKTVQINMPGNIESLNVSVATGILLYELANKYGFM